MRGEINRFFIIKQIKKPRLCSSRFLRALQQNRAQSGLLYLLNKKDKLQSHYTRIKLLNEMHNVSF